MRSLLSARTPFCRWLVRRLFQGCDWLAPVLSRALPGCLLVLALSLTAAAAGLATPMLTKAVIDEGIMGGDFSRLLFWSAISFAIGLATVGFGIIATMQHLRASQAMLGDLRLQLLGAAFHRDAAEADMPLGEAQIRIDGDTAEIQRFLFDSLLVAVTSLFRLGGGLGLMLLLDWRLALLPLLAAPLELWFLAWARPGTRHRAERVRSQRGDLNSHLAESLAQLTRLRPLGATPARHKGFALLQGDLFTGQRAQRLWSESIGAVSQILSASMRAAVLLLGGWLVIRGDWPIGSLVAFLAYAGLMSGPLRNLLGLYHAQARAQVAATRLGEMVAAACPQEAGQSVPAPVQRLSLHRARAEAGLHAPLSAELTIGETVLLDGPSGIGKSRLLDALLGEAPLAEGALRLNGSDLRSMSLRSRRQAITLVAQRPCLIRGSLRQNLTLGHAPLPDAQLWQALETVELHLWAEQNGGLDTPLAEAGQNLSGGMRQRIALARGLARCGAILVLDESFSEIDTATASRILTRILALWERPLLIFTAHSGPVRQLAFDQILVLRDTEARRLDPAPPPLRAVGQ